MTDSRGRSWNAFTWWRMVTPPLFFLLYPGGWVGPPWTNGLIRLWTVVCPYIYTLTQDFSKYLNLNFSIFYDSKEIQHTWLAHLYIYQRFNLFCKINKLSHIYISIIEYWYISDKLYKSPSLEEQYTKKQRYKQCQWSLSWRNILACHERPLLLFWDFY